MFQSIAVRQVRSPLQVAFVFSDDRTPPSKAPAVAASVGAAFASPGFRADAGECLLVGHASLVVGLGIKKDLSASGVRTIGAKLAKWLDRAAPAAIDDFNVDIQNNSVSDNQNNPSRLLRACGPRLYPYARPKAY